MASLLGKSLRSSLEKIFQKRGISGTAALLEEADKLALEELKYEETVAACMQNIAKTLSDKEGKSVRGMLELKNSEYTRPLLSYFYSIKIALRKIRFILFKIKKFNDANIDNNQRILDSIKEYRTANPDSSLPGRIRTLQALFQERKSLRNDLQAVLTALTEPIQDAIEQAERAMDDVKGFNYDSVRSSLEALQAQRGQLVEILKKQLEGLSIELKLEKDTENIEAIEDALLKLAKQTTWKNLSIIKRQRLMAIGRYLCIAALALQLPIAGTTYFLSYPVEPGKWERHHAVAYKDWFEEQSKQQKFRVIVFPSRLGHRLRGFFFPNETTRKLVIICHGRASDLYAMKELIALLQNDYNVFIFDFYGHGSSEGDITTTGVLEREDLYGAMDYIVDKLGFPEGVIVGISMGGSIAISAGSQYKPVRGHQAFTIKAIATRGAFANLTQDAFNHSLKSHFVPWVVRKPAIALADRAIGLGSGSFNPINDLNPNIPHFILQSRNDPIVDPRSAMEFKKRGGRNVTIQLDDLIHAPMSEESVKPLADFIKKTY
ncbi:alpha/beta fold hydrolase [Candidatus Woesearchaeota archaeon]|nr:alpha/beta fold hydrolase [Candidatus Woesearchaeota archaeon]